MTRVAHLPFVHALQQVGGRVYMVGGTLRDALLGREQKDLDLLITGLPQDRLIRLLRQYGRVQLIGRAFGVIKFLPRQWTDPPIDIALPRTEVSTGIGHRDFAVTFDHTLPIETDLQRRDFTINAMALDLADDRLIDPFGGYQDLQRQWLRQVSPAAFPEDPLRMLRGVQFAARFGLHVEPVTRQAMCTHAALLGGNVRVGLEDSLYIGPGQLAKSNADQVAKICRILREHALEPATPAEARARLGLKGAEHVRL